jgi:hypothetical protein
MECKGCKRFVTTTEAEIVEKRLKLNAERTIKQNKAATAILKDRYSSISSILQTHTLQATLVQLFTLLVSIYKFRKKINVMLQC